jgi:uncharacterized protein
MPKTKTAQKPRGFAAISPERLSEIARMGGLAVAPENRSYSKDRALAAAAGRKGGLVSPRLKKV